MKIPYGYVLVGEGIAIHEERADVVRSIFEYYLAGASLGKIVDMLFAKGISSSTGNCSKWTTAAVDKLLANKKYVPIVGVKVYLDAQFEKERRCNMDYDRVGNPRKVVRYQSPSLYMKQGYTTFRFSVILVEKERIWSREKKSVNLMHVWRSNMKLQSLSFSTER